MATRRSTFFQSVDIFSVRLLQSVTKRLPPIPGLGWLASKLVARYRSRDIVVTLKRWRYPFTLSTAELIDFAVIFFPQHYDRSELRLVREILKPGDIFVDFGANIGVYSVVASQQVGATGSVVAVEASKPMFERLSNLVRDNDLANVKVFNAAVGPRSGTAKLFIQTAGNAGGSTLMPHETNTSLYGQIQEIEMHPMQHFFHGRPTLVKMDIEGMEYETLSTFFRSDATLPSFFLLEDWRDSPNFGRLRTLMETNGYSLTKSINSNFLYERTSQQRDDVR